MNAAEWLRESSEIEMRARLRLSPTIHCHRSSWERRSAHHLRRSDTHSERLVEALLRTFDHRSHALDDVLRGEATAHRRSSLLSSKTRPPTAHDLVDRKHVAISIAESLWQAAPGKVDERVVSLGRAYSGDASSRPLVRTSRSRATGVRRTRASSGRPTSLPGSGGPVARLLNVQSARRVDLSGSLD